MTQTFAKKILRTSLTLVGGSFGAGGNTAVLEGFRASLEIEKGGHPSKNCAKIKIFGMKEDDMDALTTTAFHPLSVRRNLVKVEAGDASGLAIAFQGEITGAWGVYHDARPYFRVEAASGYYPAVAPAKPASFNGSTPVADVMGQLAAQMGYAFENNGVDAVLASPYLQGSLMQQAGLLADASAIEFGVDDSTLWIAPRNKPRAGDVPFLSPETGLIGYPVFDKEGVSLRAFWDPAFKIGGLIKVQSSIKAACGVWRIHGMNVHLESINPGGKWEAHLKAAPTGVI